MDRRIQRSHGFYKHLIKKANERFDTHLDQLKRDRREAKMTSLTKRVNKLPEARRKKVEGRAKALIAEEMSLRGTSKDGKTDKARIDDRRSH